MLIKVHMQCSGVLADTGPIPQWGSNAAAGRPGHSTLHWTGRRRAVPAGFQAACCALRNGDVDLSWPAVVGIVNTVITFR